MKKFIASLRLHLSMILFLLAALLLPAGAFAAEPAKDTMDMGGMSMDKPADVKTAKTLAKDVPTSYPLDVCPVSDQKLGAMGKPVVINYKGREVRFCCPACPKEFDKDPAKYLKKMDEQIIKKQKPAYPLATCVVSGDKLQHSEMGDPVDYIYKNQLVRFCCSGCVKTFEKNPAPYLKKLADARTAAAKKKSAK